MIFIELNFLIFLLIVVFAIVVNARSTESVKIQNGLLLIASYYFYAQWDWRYLTLIIINTLVSFVCALRMVDSRRPGQWLWGSVGISLSILCIFKYFNFFMESAIAVLDRMSVHVHPATLNVLLPVGISFYTFQTIAYMVDVRRGKLAPETDIVKYATFVSFFPQLVAGPIERAPNLLPQFDRLWKYDEQRIIEGLRLILFGFVLKVVVADKIAPVVDTIFATDAAKANGGDYLLGSIYFAFQIYGDFCGYSTIAIGVAKILGVELMTNFRTPYFAASFQDFWHRWHISLSTFFRDYVYFPLGGSRGSNLDTYRNIMVAFTLSGLWHGANWTYVIWGVYHGVLLCIERILASGFKSLPKAGHIGGLLKIPVVFFLTCIGWVIFRSETIGGAWQMIATIFTDPGIPARNRAVIPFVLFALVIDFLWAKDTRLEHFGFVRNEKVDQVVRWAAYSLMLWICASHWGFNAGKEFIYFQF